MLSVKKIRNWSIFIFLFGLIFFGTYSLIKSVNSFAVLSASEINIGSHSNIELHIHSDLKILINGEEQLIPANIGISPGIMRPVHTHDSTGELHIEGPYKRDFTLNDFFYIWGKTFNSECIFDYCNNKGILKMYINGEENFDFEKHILKDDEEIIIEYISDIT